jgi:hypothetical protein
MLATDCSETEAKSMRTGRSLQEFAVQLDRQNKAKRDFVAPAGAVRADDMPGRITLTRYDGEEHTGGETFTPNSLFHHQIGDALGIPAKY